MLSTLSLLFASVAYVSATEITFRLHLHEEHPFQMGDPGIVGNFNNWISGDKIMSRISADDPLRWELVLEMPPGPQEFLFMYGSWEQGAKETLLDGCKTDWSNRIIEVTDDPQTVEFGWNSCNSDPINPMDKAKEVTFTVHTNDFPADLMGDKSVTLNGNFNGWCGDCDTMYEGSYTKTARAAIAGNNDRFVEYHATQGTDQGEVVGKKIYFNRLITVNDCARVCNADDQCRSFDFYNAWSSAPYKGCHISYASKSQVALTTNYAAYDHYEREFTNTYQIRKKLPVGFYEFKYTLGDFQVIESIDGICKKSGNRYFNVEDNADTSLSFSTGWGSCDTHPRYTGLKNLRIVFSVHVPPNTAGNLPVNLQTELNGWWPPIVMDKVQQDVYEVEISSMNLFFQDGQKIAYKFGVGRDDTSYFGEDVPMDCGETTFGDSYYTNRYVTAGDANAELVILPTSNFNGCDAVDANSDDVLDPAPQWGPPGGEMPLTCDHLATPDTRRSLAFVGDQGYVACIAGEGCFLVHMSQSGSWSALDHQMLPWDNGAPDKKLTTIIGWADHSVYFYNEDGEVVKVSCGSSCGYEIQENWVCPEGEFYASVHCADDTLTIQHGGAPHESSGALINYEPGQAPTVKVIDYNDSVLHTIQLNCQCDSS